MDHQAWSINATKSLVETNLISNYVVDIVLAHLLLNMK